MKGWKGCVWFETMRAGGDGNKGEAGRILWVTGYDFMLYDACWLREKIPSERASEAEFFSFQPEMMEM